MSQVYEELKARGLIAQCTNEEKVRDLLDNHQTTFYIGFDATADSLHVGHFLQLVVMSRLQKAGHRPIALIGGGTTMIGDPTGKADMRKMLTVEEIDHNAECFRKQMRGLVNFEDGSALMLNNADWIRNFNYIEFMREVGVHFSVNRMLTAECYKSRLEKGLSFLEFNYMLLQSYDFLYLYRNEDCHLELGGDDQWSNIINGADLIRRADGKDDAYGLTFTLLTTSDGKKMGKTERGAVWLDPEKTSPYDFFQYWRNINDADVIRVMKMLTFMTLEEIAEYEKLEGAGLNRAKEKLAYEITAMVHGKDEAEKALAAAKTVFAGGAASGDMPTTTLTAEDLTDGAIAVLDILVKTGLVKSKGEGRRVIQQGGLTINDNKVTDLFASYEESAFAGDGMIIKKGKKTFHKVTM
jgi:tyrosyl-tRNA synthetase